MVMFPGLYFLVLALSQCSPLQVMSICHEMLHLEVGAQGLRMVLAEDVPILVKKCFGIAHRITKLPLYKQKILKHF